MEGADAERALAVAADKIIYAIRLGCLFFACSTLRSMREWRTWFSLGGSVRVPMGQATPRVLAWFSVVQSSPSGWVHPSSWVHWVKLLYLPMRLAPQSLSAGSYSVVVKDSTGGGGHSEYIYIYIYISKRYVITLLAPALLTWGQNS